MFHTVKIANFISTPLNWKTFLVEIRDGLQRMKIVFRYSFTLFSKKNCNRYRDDYETQRNINNEDYNGIKRFILAKKFFFCYTCRVVFFNKNVQCGLRVKTAIFKNICLS